MRIVFVTMQLGQSYVHGTERYVATLGQELRRRGHDVVFLAGNPRGETRARHLGSVIDSELGILLHPTRGWTAVHGSSPSRVQAWLRVRMPDVVHVASLGHVGLASVLAARRLGIPVVATAMDFWWICPRGTLLRDGTQICDGTPGWRGCLSCLLSDHPRSLLRGAAKLASSSSPFALGLLAASVTASGGGPGEIVRWMSRRRLLAETLNNLDHLIFPSPATRDAIVPQLRHRRWREIPYGLELQWFESPSERRPDVLSPRSLIFGFAGSLRPHKGAHLLLAAIRLLGWKCTRLRLAGTIDDDAYWAELQRAAEGLAVEFVGALDPLGMRSFLRSIDVFVLPSCWPENLPFVLLEAQAAGVPVLGSNVAGISHRISDSRMLFEAGSAEDLARAMGELKLSAETYRPHVDGVGRMTDATLAVYRDVIGLGQQAKGRDG